MSEVSKEAEALLLKESEIRVDIDAVYNSIQSFRITLRENLNLDPNYFYSKIVEIKDATMKLQGWYLEVSRETERLTRLHSSIEMHYEILRDTNLASNTAVLQAASIADRMAIINTAEGISNLRHRLRITESSLKSLVILDKAIKVVDKNLSSLENNLTKQIRIFEAQIKNLGHADGRSEALKHLTGAFASIAEVQRAELMEVGEVLTEVRDPEIVVPHLSTEIAEAEVIDIEQVDLDSDVHVDIDVRLDSDATSVTLHQGVESSPTDSHSVIAGIPESVRNVDSVVAQSDDVDIDMSNFTLVPDPFAHLRSETSNEEVQVETTVLEIDPVVVDIPDTEQSVRIANESKEYWAEQNELAAKAASRQQARYQAELAAAVPDITYGGVTDTAWGDVKVSSVEVSNDTVEIAIEAKVDVVVDSLEVSIEIPAVKPPVVEEEPEIALAAPRDPDDDSDVEDISITLDDDDVLNYMSVDVEVGSSGPGSTAAAPLGALAGGLGMDMGEFEVASVEERSAATAPAPTPVVEVASQPVVVSPAAPQPVQRVVEDFDIDSLLDNL